MQAANGAPSSDALETSRPARCEVNSNVAVFFLVLSLGRVGDRRLRRSGVRHVAPRRRSETLRPACPIPPPRMWRAVARRGIGPPSHGLSNRSGMSRRGSGPAEGQRVHRPRADLRGGGEITANVEVPVGTPASAIVVDARTWLVGVPIASVVRICIVQSPSWRRPCTTRSSPLVQASRVLRSERLRAALARRERDRVAGRPRTTCVGNGAPRGRDCQPTSPPPSRNPSSAVPANRCPLPPEARSSHCGRSGSRAATSSSS